MVLGLIYGHQLYEKHPVLAAADEVYLMEEPLVLGCDEEWPLVHHARRQALLRAAAGDFMKRHGELVESGVLARVELGDVEPCEGCEEGEMGRWRTVDVLEAMWERHDKRRTVERVVVCEVADDLLARRIVAWCEERELALVWLDSPNFVTPRGWWEEYIEEREERGLEKVYFMKDFYEAQRLRMGVLVEEDGKPVGGKWSYDEENRKKLPKGYEEPSLPEVEEFAPEVVAWVAEYFPQAWGLEALQAGEMAGLPWTVAGAREWYEVFLRERFKLFGDYEDALSVECATQQHAVLTPMLNIGLLDPKWVVEGALAYASDGRRGVEINSLEGFVRQVIGWREFMRMVYEREGRRLRVGNFWGFSAEVPESFYTGETGLLPVDTVVKRALKTGYAHHIERLMVMGVMFQLCHVHPREAYRWFMELFVDAYDWVMVPNVYGMSQFADGGSLVTKPYVCGSNYVRKMGDYPKGEWCEVWDGLFWDYIAANREFYESQPRLGMMVGNLDRMGEEKLAAHRQRAREFRENGCRMGIL